MPLVTISLTTTWNAAQRRAIADGVHSALVEAIGIPEEDRFQRICRHDPEDLIADPTYMGITRSRDVVYVEISLVGGRTEQQKRELFRLIVFKLAKSPGVRREDVVVKLLENGRADWSIGNGEAQLLTSDVDGPGVPRRAHSDWAYSVRPDTE